MANLKLIKLDRITLTVILFIIWSPVSAQSSFFNITDYGAVSDGKTINTISIQRAIDDCAGKGGGTVYFPAGKYISGTIFLKSFVTLHLESGSILEGSKILSDYPVTESKIRSYTDNYTDKSLIYGEDLNHISITGHGTIDGNGASFKVSDELRKANIFDSYKMRPYMIRLINCENVTVKDITIINSPMWVQHYMVCRNVNIDGITVNSRVNSNNDGIDIDACDGVRISNCNIISGDDAIVLKSTLDKPCRNITITNCVISSNCNAFKLGTESNGDFHNISLSNCIIHDNRLAGIALEMVDGGSLNNVTVSDVNMHTVGCAIFIRLGNRARPFLENNPKAYTNRAAAINNLKKPGMGSIFNVLISNIQATNIGITGCSITGIPSFPARDLTLSNIRISFTGGGTEDLANRKIEEFPDKYPEYAMFGTLPAYGFFCRHITGLTLDKIDLSYKEPDYRPALFLDDVKDSRISDLRAYCEEKTESVIVIERSRNIIIRDCYSPKKSGVFAAVRGSNSGIQLINSKISTCPDVDCTPQISDDREIRINKPGDVINKRLEIIRAIWNDGTIPDRFDVIITPKIQSPLHPHKVVGRVDRIEIPVTGSDSVKDLAYLFVSAHRNNRLIVFNPGQKQHDPARDYTSDMHHFEQTVKARLDSLGEKDHYYLIIDETAPNHQISEYTLKNVILPELEGKKKGSY